MAESKLPSSEVLESSLKWVQWSALRLFVVQALDWNVETLKSKLSVDSEELKAEKCAELADLQHQSIIALTRELKDCLKLANALSQQNIGWGLFHISLTDSPILFSLTTYVFVLCLGIRNVLKENMERLLSFFIIISHSIPRPATALAITVLSMLHNHRSLTPRLLVYYITFHPFPSSVIILSICMVPFS
jgi:hypothetical protein